LAAQKVNPLTKFWLSVAQAACIGLVSWVVYSVHEMSKDVAVIKAQLAQMNAAARSPQMASTAHHDE
jgi:hypothetical protein